MKVGGPGSSYGESGSFSLGESMEGVVGTLNPLGDGVRKVAPVGDGVCASVPVEGSVGTLNPTEGGVGD